MAVVLLSLLALFSFLTILTPTVNAYPPVALFTITPSSPVEGETIVFNASASYDPDYGGAIQTYLWEFRNPVTEEILFSFDSSSVFSFTFAAGSYNVTLTVTDYEPASASTSKLLTVLPAPVPPVAIFTFSPPSPWVIDQTWFCWLNASGSYDPDGNITSYSWACRDLATEVLIFDFTVTYPVYMTVMNLDAGDYNVTLTVTDTDLLTDSTWQSLEVVPAQHHLIISVDGSGTTDPEPGDNVVFEGASVTVDAYADSGWELDYWLLDGTNVGEGVQFGERSWTYTVTMDTDHELTAVFYQPRLEYTLAVDIAGSGSVTKNPDQATYAPGTVVTLTALPESGWSFSGWSDALISNTNPTTITMNGNKIVTATFTNERVQSSLYITTSKSSMVTGESITINGSLSPPLNNAKLLIQDRIGDASWSTLQQVHSDSNGRFSYSFAPSTAGDYQIRVTWEGDATTLPCESRAVPVIVSSPPPWEFYILVVAVGAFAGPSLGLAVHLWKQPLNSANRASEKLNKDFEEEKYEQCLEDLDNLIEKVEKLASSAKPLCEINEPPYSIADNLKSIKKTLSEKPSGESMAEFLVKSEIQPYLLGLLCVFNTFRKLKSLKPLRRAESSSRFFVPMVSRKAGVFDKVNRVDKPDIKDFWFIWEKQEQEPIRIYFANGRTVGARSRWHWRHIDITKPYVDNKGRIEVLILPHFHTPIIRRSKEDLCFEVFAKCYYATVRDYELVMNQPVDDDYTKAEMKTSHPPAVDYKGWEEPFKPSII